MLAELKMSLKFLLLKYAIYVYYRSSGNELYYLLGKKYWYQMTCRIKEKLAKLYNGLRSQKNKRMELFIIFAIYYSFGKDNRYTSHDQC